MDKKYKALIFDFIGVLLVKKAEYTSDQVIDEVDNIIGRVTDDILFRREIKEKYNLSDQDFEDLLRKIVDKYEPYQPLWDMLGHLKENYKLAIINNGTALTLPYFKERFPLDTSFDSFISSAKEGAAKPDPKIYELTLKKLGLKPEDCLFMDDKQKNVVGAQKVGIDSILWRYHDQGLRELKERLEQ